MATTRSTFPGQAEPPAGYEGLTIIGSEIQISGRIEGEEDLRVEGRVDGSIHLTETVYIEEMGIVQADITARDVVVSGIVLGNVTATNSVTLNAGARLMGNVSTPRLIIADGAAFAGDVDMGGEGAKEAPRADRSRATAPPPRPSQARAGRNSAASEAPRSRAAASTASRPAPAAARATRQEADDDEITVVVKHASLAKGQEAGGSAEETGKVARPVAKKRARAQVPARGKRRVNRR